MEVVESREAEVVVGVVVECGFLVELAICSGDCKDFLWWEVSGGGGGGEGVENVVGFVDDGLAGGEEVGVDFEADVNGDCEEGWVGHGV